MKIEEIEQNLFDRFYKDIKKIGFMDAAKKLEMDHAYLSRVLNKKQNMSVKKTIELLKKLEIEDES